jgi:hypothetical protein
VIRTPSDPHVASIIEALTAAHVALRVFGGVAVMADSRVMLLDEEADLREPDDPIRLAAAVRVTGDVDVAIVGSLRVAENVLSAQGYTRDERVREPPSRWRNGMVSVDLVKADATSRNEIERLLAFLLSTSAEATADGIPVFAPGELVVLKATAFVDRRERRDLVDVGRIALLDEVATPMARTRLLALVPDLPPFARSALITMRKQFADEDAPGAYAFLEYAEIPGIRFVDAREQHVRETVAHAVRSMLDLGLI